MKGGMEWKTNRMNGHLGAGLIHCDQFSVCRKGGKGGSGEGVEKG